MCRMRQAWLYRTHSSSDRLGFFGSGCWAFPFDPRKLEGGWACHHPDGKDAPPRFGGILRAISLEEREGRAIKQGYVLTIERKRGGYRPKLAWKRPLDGMVRGSCGGRQAA